MTRQLWADYSQLMLTANCLKIFTGICFAWKPRNAGCWRMMPSMPAPFPMMYLMNWG